MDRYALTLAVVGIAALGMAWMPRFTKRTGISYAIIYMLAGYLLYHFFPTALTTPDPRKQAVYTEHLTELVVLVALVGTGIKIDRAFSFKGWRAPMRLVTVAMVLSIAGGALLGYAFMGLSVAAALLLGAALAPTDPVLASDVQVGPPNERRRFEIKFSLTAEAGMNDGMAFPFVGLAILLANAHDQWGIQDFLKWLSFDLLYKIAAGTAVGYFLGWLAGFALFKLTNKENQVRDGFVALSMTMVVYGVAELLHGYGFIAVFVAAITVRHYEKEHKFHEKMYAFADQTERSLVALLLILFGGSLTTGVLDALTWPMALCSLAMVFIVRPLAGYVSLWGLPLHHEERWVIGFFGIRGMGTVFYLSFAFAQANFPMENDLWAMATFTILISLVLHGLTATKVMNRMEAKYAREAAGKDADYT